MATEVVKIIDPDNGTGTDYTSLSAWEAAMLKDLTTADEISVAKCRCTGGTADSTAVTISGWTTSATQYIKIWTDPSESYRHAGLYSDSDYRLEVLENAILVQENYVKISGIQFSRPGATQVDTGCIVINLVDAGNLIEISNCLFKGIGGTTYQEQAIYITDGDAIVNVKNCLAYNFASKAHSESNVIRTHAATLNLYNCTLLGGYRAITVSAGTCNAKNVFCGSSSNEDYYRGGGTLNKTTCASEDESADDTGTGENASGTCPVSIAISTDNFVDVTIDGGEDFHLTSGSDLVGAATNLYNDANYPFQDDIDNQDRGGSGASWDIGADEYVAAGGDTYSETATDGFKGGESLARISTFRSAIIDGFSGGESMARRSDMIAALSDGGTLAEALSRIITARRTAADGAKLGESMARNISIAKTAADGIVASDTPAGAVSLSLSITDSALIGDQAARRLDLSATLADGATLGEVLATALVLVPAITDGAKFAETLASDLSGVIDEIITDGFKAGESVSSVAAFIRAVADGAKLGDSLASVLSAARAVADGIKAGDQVARVSTAQRSATDSIILSEVTAGELVAAIIQAIAADGIKFGEATQTVAQFDIVVADGVRLAETVASIMQMLAAAADAFNAGDAAASVEAAYIAQGVVRVTFTGASGGRITFTVRRPTITFTVN